MTMSFRIVAAILLVLALYVWRCDALLRATLLSSSTNNTAGTNDTTSPTSIESTAYHAVMMHPNPFNITAMLYHPTKQDRDTCSIPDLNQPSIILLQQSLPPPDPTCVMCVPPACLGVVRLADATPETAALGAHIVYWLYGKRHIIHQPRVVVRGGTYVEEWLLEHVDNGNVQVTITSGDRNEAAEVLQSVPWKIWNFISCAHTLSNLLVVLFKLFAFKGTKYADIPNAVPFVLVPELFSNMMRFMHFVSMAFFEMRLFGYEIQSVTGAVPFTLGVASTLGIAVIVYNSYRNAADGDDYRTGIKYKCSRIIVWTLSAFMTLDVMARIYAGFFAELFSTRLTVAFYTVLQVPVSIVFIRFGNSTARLFLSQRNSLRTKELHKRQHFARRVKFSGIAMLINIISLILFSALNTTSASAWLYLFSISHETSNGVASFQIAAVRTPGPAIRKSTGLGRNIVYPQKHHT